MATVAEVKAEMARNSAAWHTATPAQKKQLEAANQALGRSVGGTYTASTGTWAFPPETSAPKQPIAYSGGQASPTAQAAVSGNDSAKSKRLAQMQTFTGWDNDSQVRSLQEASWAIYVDTGRWDTAEQKQLHDQAEKIRKYNNPMYGGLPYGPGDWLDAEKITPRDTSPTANDWEANIGSYLKTGGIAVVALFALVIFGRR